MTQPRANINVLSYDYVINEMVNVAAVPNHGVMDANGRFALRKLELHSA